MKAEFIDGQLVITIRMKDEDDLANIREMHGRMALWDCWASWADAPKTAKLVFKPAYNRVKESK